MTWKITSLCALALCLAAGCPDDQVLNNAMSCTEIGCSDMLSVTLKPGSGSFIAGDYTVTFDEGAGEQTCTLTLNDQCSNGQGSCLAGGDCNALSFEGTVQLNFGAIQSLDLRVQRDGAELGSQVFTPSYTEVQPNGEGCPPICKQATEELTLVEPA